MLGFGSLTVTVNFLYHFVKVLQNFARNIHSALEIKLHNRISILGMFEDDRRHDAIERSADDYFDILIKMFTTSLMDGLDWHGTSVQEIARSNKSSAFTCSSSGQYMISSSRKPMTLQ